MKTLAIIPARGGSKGVQGKNIKLLNGKPLIEYTVDAAKQVFATGDICVSTDSIAISEVVKRLGIDTPFLRPAELAEDNSSTYEVLLHALAYYKSAGKEYDTVVLLQPTSPFRIADDIKQAMQLYTAGTEMVVSVKETDANPYYVLFEENAAGYLEKSKEGNFSSRQQCPVVWQYNGAVYVINVSALLKGSHLNFKKVKKYVMPTMRSLDIDTEADWDYAEFLLKRTALV